MAATNVGTMIVCTGTTTVTAPPGGFHVVGITCNATTSATITDGTTEFFACGSTKEHQAIDFRTNTDLVVTVTGGGYVTLHLRTH
jgi:hypothetical protein